MKKISLLKNMLFWEAPYAFKEPGEQNINHQTFITGCWSYFYITKTANKQNNRLWLETRPKSGIERPLYYQKVLVWCAMSSQKIYGPYFFESTVNQNNYHNMLVRFFWSKVVREDYKKYYFQQDGASPHL